MLTTGWRKLNFAISVGQLMDCVHAMARGKGWWDEDRNDAECLMLMVTELSEACEALRHGTPPDDKLPQYSGLTVELADCIIRIFDYAAARKLPLAQAILDKVQFNATRPHKHGKSF